MHLLHEREEKLAIQKQLAQLEEEKESAETKRLELEQALEEFVRTTDKKGKLAAVDKKASLDQGRYYLSKNSRGLLGHIKKILKM